MAQPTSPSDDRPAGVSVSLMPAGGVSDAELSQITEIFADLVSAGAALGWVQPPDRGEVAALLADVAEGITAGESSMALAVRSGDDDREESGGANERIVGIAYWRRYTRPTHRPHVDIEKVAVDPRVHGGGIGKRLMAALITSAREADVEVITLDLRGDNERAIRLYESLGFTRYGLLPGFVAVGEQRFDTHLYALDLRVT